MKRVVAAIGMLLCFAGSAAAQHDLTPPPTTGSPVGGTVPAADPPVETETLATALSAPRPGIELAPETPAEPAEPAEEPWTGPAVELGYTHYNLYDGYEGGDVHAGTFGGYLPFGPIRVGAWAELGVRQYSLSDDDLLVRANLIGGYQYLGWRPFAPYAGVTATVGVAIGQRFRSPESYGFGGAGIELGADLVLVKNLWLGVSFGYQRVSMAGSGFDLWVFRLRTGL